MREQWRIFWLLMHKNNITRKKFWVATSMEILFPILYFLGALVLISLHSEPPISVQENTYHERISKEELIQHLDRQTKLYYMPQNNFTDEIMKKVQSCLIRPNEGTIGFKTEDDMLKSYTLQQTKDQQTNILAIVFGNDNGETMPKKLEYTIRSSYRLPYEPFSHYMDLGNTVTNEFILNVPFVTIQMCIDESFIEMAVPKSELQTEMSIQEMPYPPHERVSKMDSDLKEILSKGACLAFMLIPFLLPTYIASERAIGMNALMVMNGVRSIQNLLSWQIHSMCLSVWYVTAVTALFTFILVSGSRVWLSYGDFSLFWLLLFLNVAHIISFCLHVGTHFSRPLLAEGVAVLIYFIAVIIEHFLEVFKLHAIVPLGVMLIPSVATLRIFNEFAVYENKMIGAHWSNIFETANLPFEGHGSLGYLMLFSIIGIVFHFFMAVYIDIVIPGKYGVRKHPLFCLKWFKSNKVHNDEEGEIFIDCEADTTRFETVPDGVLTPGIRIRKLRKSYVIGCCQRREVQTVDAIRGISLDFFKGQITALLGPNGAGKTTMMSILTGLTRPSSGTVHINGKNIKEDLDAIRDDISLCPQENMLFPNLTVFEQIQFFGLLKRKNQSAMKIEKEVNSILEKLGLFKKKDVLPDKLSGGQKRRVCLGMALIGNASVIILDEPTSGMDPETRRETWDIILGLRNKQRTIIISTHSMEEADILGDRIAIMCDGKMRCYGSSMFLKKRYGGDYQVVTLSTEPKCVKSKIKDMVNSIQLRSEYGKMILNVPYTSELPEALDNMESQKEELGITGIGVSMISLEQVFLQVLRGEEDDTVDGVDEENRPIKASKPRNKLRGWQYSKQVFYALLAKKAVYTWTNLAVFLIIILGPLMTLILLPFADYVPQDSTAIHPLDLSVYRYPAALVSSESDLVKQKYKDFIEHLHGTVMDTEKGTNFSEALLSEARRDIAEFHNSLITSAEFKANQKTVTANGFYSSIAALSAPVTLNVLSNSLLKAMAGDDYSISVNSQSFPNILALTMNNETSKIFNIVTKTVLFITFLVTFTALFAIHPLLETMTVVKQLQRMTGVTSFCYWGTMFLFDCLVFVVLILFLLLGHYVMDIVLELRLYRGIEIGIIALMLLLFAFNLLPLVYIHSFLKKSTNTVFLIVCVFPIIIATFESVLFVTLKNIEGYETISLIQQRIFSFVPQVSLALGLLVFFNTSADNARCRRLPNHLNEFACIGRDKCCELKCWDGQCDQQLRYFTNFEKDSGLEEFLVYLAGTSFALFFILWLLENDVIGRLKARICKRVPKCCNDVDEEVKKEKKTVALAIKQRLENKKCEDDNIFLVHKLSKSYGKLEAVKQVNFAIKTKECFGLLGVNGAGKSTTFRMLTGEENPSTGELFMRENSIQEKRRKYLSQMGYCPQTDALLPSLNAWDHLRLIALLRGIPKKDVKKEVEEWINRLGLNACAHQPSSTYSGGNKRRLNVAMALIASPDILLLDEPTTGVDPAAKRLLWRVLQSCRAAGQAIILTSHSMEECEVLCNRLVIMVDGQLMCIGGSPHLKKSFGAGYDIAIKLNLKRSDDNVTKVENDIEVGLKCERQDKHPGLLSYHVSDTNTTWKKMFGLMNDLKTKHKCIEDFSVSSATLEQLLIKFAKDAKKSESGSGNEHMIQPNDDDSHGEWKRSSFSSVCV